MKVWILRSGQDYEGEQIDGVFARREDGRQPFIDLALIADGRRRGGRDRERVTAGAGVKFDDSEDGDAVEYRAGDEWVLFEPHDVIGAA